MVEQQGFKPWTSALQRQRSNQLSYYPSGIILAKNKFNVNKNDGMRLFLWDIVYIIKSIKLGRLEEVGK